MITYVYTMRGVVFEHPEAPWESAKFSMQDAVLMLAQRLKGNLSGGYLRLGPGRYGHLAQAIQAEVRQTPDQVLGRVHATGKAAFRAPILERGAVAHYLAPRRHRALRIREHGVDVLRAYAHHPGIPATHVFERTLTTSMSDVTSLFERYAVKAVA